VVSPLKALMNQQIAALQKMKIPGTFINGDLGPREKDIRYQLLRDGAIKFLYCTPERFDPEMVRQTEVEEIVRAARVTWLSMKHTASDRWGRIFARTIAGWALSARRLVAHRCSHSPRPLA